MRVLKNRHLVLLNKTEEWHWRPVYGESVKGDYQCSWLLVGPLQISIVNDCLSQSIQDAVRQRIRAT